MVKEGLKLHLLFFSSAAVKIFAISVVNIIVNTSSNFFIYHDCITCAITFYSLAFVKFNIYMKQEHGEVVVYPGWNIESLLSDLGVE
jgi:hypothetical protein